MYQCRLFHPDVVQLEGKLREHFKYARMLKVHTLQLVFSAAIP